jgi:hypothetical protein
MADYFDQAKQHLEGTPGYQVRRSTITTQKWALLPGATWIVESVRTDETQAIFLQTVSAEGSQRLVVPGKVAEAIYRQYQSIMEIRRKERAKNAARTRKRKAAEKISQGAGTGGVKEEL